MYDILVYMFKTYFSPDIQHNGTNLTHHLMAEGFEIDDIHHAIHWLDGIKQDSIEYEDLINTTHQGSRVYSYFEHLYFDPEAIGFLHFLEKEQQITPYLREIIINRALAVQEEPINLSQLKVIVLMVLWSRNEPINYRIFEELLKENNKSIFH